MPGYQHPPIIEAVIELRWSSVLKISQYNSVLNKLKKNYPVQTERKHITANYNMEQDPIQHETKNVGYELTSKEGTERIRLEESSFLLVQLAPYHGWENMIARFLRDWDLIRKHVAILELERIGARYVNRIDIPIAENSAVKIEEYLNFYPHFPDIESNTILQSFFVQFVRSSSVPKMSYSLTCAGAQPPSPEYVSFVIDIDVYREEDLKNHVIFLNDLLNELRKEKNRVFELSITDQARSLFEDRIN